MAKKELDVRVYPIDEPKGSTKAFASVAVNDLIAIRGIRLVEGENGMFVTMPQSLDKKTEEYHDIAFPLNGDLRKAINNAVLDEYDFISSLPLDKRAYHKSDPDAANSIDPADVKLDIRVYPLNEPKGSTKAFASVSVDDLIAIRGVRIVEGKNGLFTAMPQSQDKNGERHDIAFPLSGELRKAINKAVIDEFKSLDKSAERKNSLGDRLAEGAERAARSAAPRAAAAKSHGAGVLE